MGVNINSNYISAININTGISVSGTLSVSSNSFYNVVNYQTINIKPEDLLETRLVTPSQIANYNNNLTYIADYTFYSCTNLFSINSPACTSIGRGAFCNCQSLTTADFSNCTSLGGYAFQSCSSLTSANFPVCSSIAFAAFEHCDSLTEINFPVCTSIGNSAFYRCLALTSISFPVCANIDTWAFYYCLSLAEVNLPACKNINGYAFGYCYNLLSLYLLGSSFCSLSNVNAFRSTPISDYTTSTGGVYGSIYVPASLLATYQSATNWATYSSRFVGI